MKFNFLSESGCPGFEDVQDVLLKLIYIFRNCANSNIPQYQYKYYPVNPLILDILIQTVKY
jgi:hypothetical protein